MDKLKFGAIILAGGKSSRMGADKGLLMLENKPLVAHVIETLKQLTTDIIIVSNQKEYKVFGLPIYEDIIKEAGPLAGIYTGLTHAIHQKNIVVSCDVPFVSTKLLNWLIQNSENYDVTIPTNNNKTHQVIGVYDKNCACVFKQELDNNQRKMKVALEKVRLNIVDANQFNAKEFTNVNTPAELKEIQ